MDAWQQRGNESDDAYIAFLAYRDMMQSDGKRSYRNLAGKLGKDFSLISRWASEHEWQDRIRAYDAHINRIRDEAIEESIKGEVAQTLERHRSIAIMLLNEATDALMKRVSGEQDTTEEGKSKPPSLTPYQIARFVEVGLKAERQALGISTEIIEERHSLTGKKFTLEDIADAATGLELWIQQHRPTNGSAKTDD